MKIVTSEGNPPESSTSEFATARRHRLKVLFAVCCSEVSEEGGCTRAEEWLFDVAFCWADGEGGQIWPDILHWIKIRRIAWPKVSADEVWVVFEKVFLDEIALVSGSTVLDEEPVGVAEESVTGGEHWNENLVEISSAVNGSFDEEGTNKPEGGNHPIAVKWLPRPAEAGDGWHWIVGQTPQSGVAAVGSDVAGERHGIRETEIVPTADGPLVVALPPLLSLVAVVECDFRSTRTNLVGELVAAGDSSNCPVGDEVVVFVVVAQDSDDLRH